MPSKGSYAVTNINNDDKTSDRDQSYRSCILTLLIFFLMCIILILASLATKKSGENDYRDERRTILAKTGSVEGFATDEPNSDVEGDVKKQKSSSTIRENDFFTESAFIPVNNGKAFERYIDDVTEKSTELPVSRERTFETTEEINLATAESIGLPVDREEISETESTTKSDEISMTSDRAFDRYSIDDSTKQFDIDSESSTLTNIFNIDDKDDYDERAAAIFISSTIPSVKDGSIDYSELSSSSNTEKAYEFDSNETQSISTEVFESTTEETMSNSEETSSTIAERYEIKMADVDEFTKRFSTEKQFVDDQTSLINLLVGKYFGNESTTSRNDDSNANWLDKMADGTTQNGGGALERSETAKFLETTTKLIETTDFEDSNRKTTRDVGVDEKSADVCETGSCKQMASKIVSRMNHSADPCDDFYEYACGGFEADYQMNDNDPSLKIYETVERQAKRHKNHSDYNKFYNYYDSCVNYETKFNIEHRIALAKEVLEKIGKFYTTANWPKEFQGFTQLLANMLLHDRPLLFDIVPDINETNPELFTLKIGPIVDSKVFQFLNEPHQCENDEDESDMSYVDLDRLYRNYKNCKNDTRRFVTSIKQALTELGIFDSLKNNYNISQYIDRTVINIDLEIIEKILWNYPSESEIHDAYRSKRYTIITLGALQEDCQLLNWTQLINSLTGLELDRDAQLQIYHKDRLIEALRNLYDFGRRQPVDLNNALLGLWARNIFQDLVATRSSTNLVKHCLYIATHFMENEASGLYMSSFTESEVRDMKTMLGQIFRELLETMRLEIRGSQWADEWGREVLLKKLNDIKISLPDASLIKNKNSHELNITDNYFVNSMNLMKKYRTLIYSVINKNPKHLEQIWTFFASPLDWMPRTIYALNLIAMPFGAIDWTIVSKTDRNFDYITQATIGNLIAREIAHNFDVNGIRYWNGSRDSEFAILTNDDTTKAMYEDYINCHRDLLYQEPMEMSMPMTGQRVSFTIPRSSLNERLSDAVGMRLANDTLARLGKAETTKRLPWLDLDVTQLFYLAYAQAHCTKTPLTSSYVSIHENPYLPSRVRLFVVASNNKLIGEAWKCPEGSRITPPFVCDVFPHFENRDDGLDAA